MLNKDARYGAALQFYDNMVSKAAVKKNYQYILSWLKTDIRRLTEMCEVGGLTAQRPGGVKLVARRREVCGCYVIKQ
jgi:hypothetical protein